MRIPEGGSGPYPKMSPGNRRAEAVGGYHRVELQAVWIDQGRRQPEQEQFQVLKAPEGTPRLAAADEGQPLRKELAGSVKPNKGQPVKAARVEVDPKGE